MFPILTGGSFAITKKMCRLGYRPNLEIQTVLDSIVSDIAKFSETAKKDKTGVATPDRFSAIFPLKKERQELEQQFFWRDRLPLPCCW